MNNPANQDPYGFSKLTQDQLRKVVVDIVKQNVDLDDQKKEYVASTNEVIKENKKRMLAALEAMKTAERQAHDDAIELAGNEYLRNAAKSVANV